MIKKFSLTFNSQELENTFKEWLIKQNHLMYETTLITLSTYLILNLIDQHTNIIYIITTSITLCIQLTMLFFFRRYPMYREYIKGLNIIVIGILIDIYRWLNYGQNFMIGAMKLSLFLQGNRFITQSLFFAASQATEMTFSIHAFIPLLIDGLFCLFFIYIRYVIELKRRRHYLSHRSRIFYENLIEEQLPAWIVLIKYDKQQAQLRIDKINKVMCETFDLYDDQKFREFLRDSNIKPLDGINLKQFNFEGMLTKELQQKQQNSDQVTKFMGRFMNNEKKWQFQITKIYFNTLEPTILLLFIEQSGELCDFFNHQLKWRDQQLVNHSKMCLNYLKNQINLLKFIKQIAPQQQLVYIANQICNSYILFNQSLNILNLTKITYNKLKYNLNEFSISELIKQLKEDLFFYNQQQFDKLIIKTDRSKLISIILSISEFIRLMLAINTNDEKQLYELHPLGHPIKIKFEKFYDKKTECIKITMTHQLLHIPQDIQKTFLKAQSYCDHQKRNWGVNHYYENIQNLSDKFHQINVTTHNVTQSQMPFLELEQTFLQQQKRTGVYLDGSTEPFSTLGLPIAQYLICQIGPHSQIKFIDKKTEHIPDLISFRNALSRTKIQFTIYEDLDSFIYQLNQQDPNPYLDFFISIPNNKFVSMQSLSPQHPRKSGNTTTQFLGSKLN